MARIAALQTAVEQGAAADVEVRGAPTPEDLRACWELGAVLAAGLVPDG